ncbi:carboxypeptidase S [Xylariaceae sp. FL0804]|nr:carboxypeptidase S [Xylariaceae sp. FL0804]
MVTSRLALAGSALLALTTARSIAYQEVLGQADTGFKCELPSPLDPSKDGLDPAREIFSGKEALELQVKRHSTLVKIPSISYDDNGEPGEDPRWDIFYTVHKTLAELYPNVHRRMDRETVNTFGLVWTIKGSDPALKPLMLAAHQDVVPVADDSTWKYPPFSAHFDGQWLWGRGASDDKNMFTSIMSALEELLSNPKWTPRRTIILASGFDEECSGRRGAGMIGPYLEQQYGPNAMAMILDEGGMGLELLEGDTLYALPAVTEKAHVDVWMELHVNGGHSSIPYPHTGIGILAEIVNAIESNPWTPKVIEGSPVHNHMVCQAKHSPKSDTKLTKLVESGDLESLAEMLATTDRSTQYRIQTSQAVDYFIGGVKINAMPESVLVGVNHRIAPQDSIPEVKANILEQIQPIAEKFGLTVSAFKGEPENPEFLSMDSMDDDIVDPMYEVAYNGTLILTSSQRTHAAPISPTSGEIWDIFSGTIQHSFAFEGGKVVPVGELMTGNTDTRHYLNLSRNIYRWSPARKGTSFNGHTVDERVDMYAHLEMVGFFYDLIRNFDATPVATVEGDVDAGEL